MSDALSQDDISTSHTSTSQTTDPPPSGPCEYAEKGDEPNRNALWVILGALVLNVGLLAWSGSYTDAVIFGAVGVGVGCIARHRTLTLQGEEDAAQRWVFASYAISLSVFGYAGSLLFGLFS